HQGSPAEPLWVRVGGGLEELCSGRRHGPADPDFPPPGGPWEGGWISNRLIGWASPGRGRTSLRTVVAEGERITRERRAPLRRRRGHRVRSSVLALQESAGQGAYGRGERLEQIYEQAQELGRRAIALETVAVDPQDPPRAVVIGAVLGGAAPGARPHPPEQAGGRAPEAGPGDAGRGGGDGGGGGGGARER